MLRRNFVASLAALFAVRKLPKVEDSGPMEKGNSIFAEVNGDYYYHNQFKRWVRIKAAEEIDVGALVYIDKNGMARDISNKLYSGYIQGVCMVNNWPEDIVVALYA